MERRRNTDIVIVAIGAAVAGIVAAFTSYSAVRAVFVLPLLFVFPGYAITAASFGARRVDAAVRLVLTLALSTSTAILGALALNATSYGLRARSWALMIVVVVWIACWIAAVRRPPEPQDARRRPALARIAARDVTIVVVAVMVGVGAVAFAMTPLPAKNIQGYTALSMLPTRSGTRVRIQISNSELERHAYRLEVRLGARPAFIAARIELGPGQQWTRTIAVALTVPKRPVSAEATLGIDHGAIRYRTVRVWLGH